MFWDYAPSKAAPAHSNGVAAAAKGPRKATQPAVEVRFFTANAEFLHRLIVCVSTSYMVAKTCKHYITDIFLACVDASHPQSSCINLL